MQANQSQATKLVQKTPTLPPTTNAEHMPASSSSSASALGSPLLPLSSECGANNDTAAAAAVSSSICTYEDAFVRLTPSALSLKRYYFPTFQPKSIMLEDICEVRASRGFIATSSNERCVDMCIVPPALPCTH